MRTEITRQVSGTSSAGRARLLPCLAMYSMLPW